MVKFECGTVACTPGVGEFMKRAEMRTLMNRHLNGDWGDVCISDAKANDEAVANEGQEDRQDRVLSSYQSENGTKVWIITEWDRSVTTILLPSEY